MNHRKKANMEQKIYHIYDKVFKKILTLSSKAVVNLINGLFDTQYSPDSTITYNWTEFQDKELRRVLADTIVTVNGRDSYHMEAQIYQEEDIVFRVFEYGYHHANRIHQQVDNIYHLHFPQARIIYLYSEKEVPDKSVLRLNFGAQGYFDYEVSNFQFLKNSTEELNRKKMIILMPFALLRLRKAIEKKRSPENLEALKNLIQNDILGSINENLRVENITVDDARQLRRLTHKLYEHIYAHYEEMEEMNDMDESLITEIDIMIKERDEALAKQEAYFQQQLAEKDDVIAEKDDRIAKKEAELVKQEEEIEFLKQQLAELTK